MAWVDEFDRTLRAAQAAVMAPEPAAAPLLAAIGALGRLRPEAARINGEMIGAARRLGPGLVNCAKILKGSQTRPRPASRPPPSPASRPDTRGSRT